MNCIEFGPRDKMSKTGGKFVAGPEPRNSLAPEGAEYSGLLECPLTTRITKDIDSNYITMQSGSTCPKAIRGGVGSTSNN